MSDASDYYSDSTESDEEEESFQVPNKISLPINAAKKFGNYIEDESEVEDSEPDDADQDADEVYDEQDGGRIKDILDDIPDDDDNDNSSDDEIEIEEEQKEKGDESNYIKTKKTTQQLIIDDD